MPGFGDSAVLILLALLLFGPKKLPQLARQLGKLMADFRRASNEFRTQMEEELRISEQADRQKQVAAIEAAAPAAAIPEPEHPHLPPPETGFDYGSPSDASADEPTDPYLGSTSPNSIAPPAEPEPEPAAAPLPIATSGDLSILPPATGLPTPKAAASTDAGAPHTQSELETETLHG